MMYPAELFLKWEMCQTEVIEKKKHEDCAASE